MCNTRVSRSQPFDFMKKRLCSDRKFKIEIGDRKIYGQKIVIVSFDVRCISVFTETQTDLRQGREKRVVL